MADDKKKPIKLNDEQLMLDASRLQTSIISLLWIYLTKL